VWLVATVSGGADTEHFHHCRMLYWILLPSVEKEKLTNAQGLIQQAEIFID